MCKNNIKIIAPLNIDLDLLKEQLEDMLVSNIKEESKNGIHNVLGTIIDMCEDNNLEIDKIVPFKEKYVIKYIDNCIEHWRNVRDNSLKSCYYKYISHYYIDAFQSIRMSLFGKLKE